jgi:hypothetical protein
MSQVSADPLAPTQKQVFRVLRHRRYFFLPSLRRTIS